MTREHAVLLVDDERHIRRYLRQVLEHCGAKVIYEAKNGREGIDLFREHKPDVVILDINMPTLDGQETLRSLRAISTSVQIIMLTSIANENVVEQCAKDGASFFIRKDVPPQELGAELQSVMSQLDHSEAG